MNKYNFDSEQALNILTGIVSQLFLKNLEDVLPSYFDMEKSNDEVLEDAIDLVASLFDINDLSVVWFLESALSYE